MKRVIIIILSLLLLMGSVLLIYFLAIKPMIQYNEAKDFADNGRYAEAGIIYFELGHYKDSAEILESISAKIISGAKIGDVVYFGRFEQDNNHRNGDEAIEWRILEQTDKKMLVYSEKFLTIAKYNFNNITDLPKPITWADCSLRNWLNHDFIDNAFNDTEETAILETEVSNPDNSEFHTEGGVDTIDRMFLLSIDEVKMYLPNKKERIGKFTKYTKYLRTQYQFKNELPIWWLRSPGIENYYAECINPDGNVGGGGLPTSASYPGVRPAMWLDLECIN